MRMYKLKSAKLYQLLKNLLAPDIPSDQTLDKLKDALKKHLTPKPLIIPSRHKFLNRKQTEGEGISTYIAELRALAMNCDYDKDMLNIMLRDVFVSGLRDKMILDRLFEEDNINLEKTLHIALAMEKAFKGTNDIMGRAINSMQTFKKHMDKKSNFTKAERKHYIVHDAQVPTMQKRIVDLFQVNVISVGKLGTLNRHASHLKRQMRNRLNKNRKFDVGDRVAVRVYRAANTRWKFGTIVNQDGVLHYIIDVQGTLVRRHVDQIHPVGDKVQENIIPLMHQRFPSSEVRENNSNIQHAETAEDISKDLNKELGSSSVQGVPSTDVAVPDLSQSSAKETDESTSSSRVGRNQTTVMRICDRWMQEGTTDRRDRSHPPQCTTSREDRKIVRMTVTDRSVPSRTVA
ncbi:uncharacterized protein K02A2.6 [Trichonephila clavipes]|nr:uncharacterized protein K02A2.6 [Trichonephila clavipes]